MDLLSACSFYISSTPSTSSPKLHTSHTFNPSTLNPQPSTLNPQPSTLNPQPSTLNPQPSTSNLQPSTLNPQPSTLNLPQVHSVWGGPRFTRTSRQRSQVTRGERKVLQGRHSTAPYQAREKVKGRSQEIREDHRTGDIVQVMILLDRPYMKAQSLSAACWLPFLAPSSLAPISGTVLSCPHFWHRPLLLPFLAPSSLAREAHFEQANLRRA